MLLIIGVLTITGIKGIALFALLMFLGMLTINMPYEFLPTIWQDWVYPWLPMRFLSAGLSDIFYIGGSVLNTNTLILTYIGLGGLVLLLLSFFKKEKNKGE